MISFVAWLLQGLKRRTQLLWTKFVLRIRFSIDIIALDMLFIPCLNILFFLTYCILIIWLKLFKWPFIRAFIYSLLSISLIIIFFNESIFVFPNDFISRLQLLTSIEVYERDIIFNFYCGWFNTFLNILGYLFWDLLADWGFNFFLRRGLLYIIFQRLRII